VVPRVKTISALSAVPRKRPTMARAVSNRSVAATLSAWTALCTLPVSRASMLRTSSSTASGFCAVAALSR
jgi:hypothetical protein